MKNELKHKLYLGIRGFVIRIPPFLSSKGAKKGQEGELVGRLAVESSISLKLRWIPKEKTVQYT